MEEVDRPILPHVSEGVRRQWELHGRPWPALFEHLAVSPAHLLGLLAIRAHACTPDARAICERLEHRLAAAFDVPPICWPSDFARPPSRAPSCPTHPILTLARLSPRRAALLLAALPPREASAARVAKIMLEAALGAYVEFPLAEQALASALAPIVPESWRPRWSSVDGSSPPRVFDSDEESHQALIEAMRAGEIVDRGGLMPAEAVALAFASAAVSTAIGVPEASHARAAAVA